MARTADTNKITVGEVRAYKSAMTSSKKASREFLERVGVIKDGKIAPAYKESKTKVSYRHDKL